MATPTWFKAKFSYLKDCVEVTEQVSMNFGGNCSEDEFSKVIDISLTSSYFNLKLNSIRAYGFLDYKEGEIKLTQLGEQLATPIDDGDRSTALLTAMINFSIFKNLTERYRGKNEPDKKYVENAVATEGKIKNREEASDWALCFLESARFAGLFRSGAFLDSERMEKAPQSMLVPSERKVSDQGSTGTAEEVRVGWLTYPVPVPGGMARIIVPEELSRPAWEKLRKLLEAIEPAKEGN